MNKGHRYKVEATRKVLSPQYGPEAYYSDTHRKEFSFGKGKEFSSGKEALKAAEEYAASLFDKAGSVSIWKMNGYGGTGNYLKNDNEQRFLCAWDKMPNPFSG